MPLLDRIHKLAESGDISSQKELGRIYFNGEGVTRDREKGISYFSEAARRGDREARKVLPDAYYKLGKAYYKGDGVPRDPNKGKELCEKAADWGHIEARKLLSDYYFRKGMRFLVDGVEEHRRSALSHLEKAAEMGHSEAKVKLSELYFKEGMRFWGYNGKQHLQTALVNFEKAADLGHGDVIGPISEINHQLGMQFYCGNRASRDIEQAITHLEKAAGMGNNESQLILGDIYFDGNVVDQNIQNACKWYKTAADHGSVKALVTLGDIYYKGYGVTQDRKTAACLMLKAAELGSTDAQEFLGMVYERGNGVSRNLNRALNWYRQAAENGSTWADEGRIRCSKLIEKAKKERLTTLAEIRKCFELDYMDSDSYYEDQGWAQIISQAEYKQEKLTFVKNWVKSNCRGLSIDDNQAAAIATVNGHVQVVARAGSGKTSVLVNRAFFLMNHCNISPGRMLILAFNRKAVEEIRERLVNLLVHSQSDSDKVELPHVLTFHALAYSIVHPLEDLIYDSEDQPKLSRVVSDIVLQLIKTTEWERRIRDLLLDFFRDDWDKIISSGHGKNKAEVLHQLRSPHSSETLGGEFVKSPGEKAIANFLFEHEIEYTYEKPRRWNGMVYRPDFTLDKHNKVIIEYFGVHGDPEYDRDSVEKRRYWQMHREYLFIELNPQQIKSGDYQRIIKQKLATIGIVITKLTEEAIWRKIKDRAIGGFTKAVSNFVSRCRKEVLTTDDLRLKIEEHSYLKDDDNNIERRFYEISLDLYGKYLDNLRLGNKEDFNGLIQQAIRKISDGHTMFHRRKSGSGNLMTLSHILVDEFQDFSRLFFDMLKSIEQKNADYELFCVGDDWQAINRFAGSDLRYFNGFGRYFGKFTPIVLSTNYRSDNAIVEIGNRLMNDYGEPATAHSADAGEVVVAELKSLNEYQSQSFAEYPDLDLVYSAVLRLITKFAASGQKSVVLCRTNTIGYPVADLKDYLTKLIGKIPKNQRNLISISTAHSYKGMENDAVIVFADEYPFLHPHWVFGRLFGDSEQTILEDERRLFYVAMSRAKNSLALITDVYGSKGFMEELKDGLDTVDWDKYRIDGEEHTLTVVVTGTTARTSSSLELRKSGYIFNDHSTKGPCWFKKTGSFDEVLREPWIQTSKYLTRIGSLYKITIQFLDHQDRQIQEIQISEGKVRRIP